MDKTAHSQQEKRYGTLIVDPPLETGQRGTYGAIKHYPLMSVEEVKRMPIGNLVADDAHIWLWVGNQTLKIGFSILEAWGFQVKSVFTWCKPRLGLGVYLRNGTEHALLGVRGRAPLGLKRRSTGEYSQFKTIRISRKSSIKSLKESVQVHTPSYSHVEKCPVGMCGETK